MQRSQEQAEQAREEKERMRAEKVQARREFNQQQAKKRDERRRWKEQLLAEEEDRKRNEPRPLFKKIQEAYEAKVLLPEIEQNTQLLEQNKQARSRVRLAEIKEFEKKAKEDREKRSSPSFVFLSFSLVSNPKKKDNLSSQLSIFSSLIF